MIERELKLHVPQAARAPIAKALRAQKARRTSLHAYYYDTATRELAHARIALRLRKEGRHWVQTVKAPGADALTRIEVNHVRPGPTLDLQLYNDTPIQDILARLEHPLIPRYETKVTRLVLQTTLNSSVVEIAYDQGVVSAAELELPISEIEFELVSGAVKSLFDIGELWLERYGLIMDLRSKAERGDALANLATRPENASTQADESTNGQTGTQANPVASLWAARRAKGLELKGKTGITAAYQLCANECLSQIIQNTAYIAGVDTALAGKNAHVEYVHQARVGIRRLRSCWKLFKHHVEPVEAAANAQLRLCFGLFGGSRDADITQLLVEPQLINAGLPDYQPSRAQPEPHAQPEAIAASVPLQLALLRLLGQLILLNEGAHEIDAAAVNHAMAINTAAPAASTASDYINLPALRPVLTKRLNNWLKKIAKAGSEFTSLPIDKQHDLRKEVKNLRYCLDFTEHLLAKPELRPLRSSLTQIQAVLGDLNDYYVAQDYYFPLVQTQPQLWFAVGWLCAAQDQKKTLAQALFRKLGEHKPLKN